MNIHCFIFVLTIVLSFLSQSAAAERYSLEFSYARKADGQTVKARWILDFGDHFGSDVMIHEGKGGEDVYLLSSNGSKSRKIGTTPSTIIVGKIEGSIISDSKHNFDSDYFYVTLKTPTILNSLDTSLNNIIRGQCIVRFDGDLYLDQLLNARESSDSSDSNGFELGSCGLPRNRQIRRYLRRDPHNTIVGEFNCISYIYRPYCEYKSSINGWPYRLSFPEKNIRNHMAIIRKVEYLLRKSTKYIDSIEELLN